MTNSELQARVESEYRRDINTVYHCDVDIAGDLISGILLSQIVYYYGLRADDGKSKLRVFKDGYYWLAKGRDDWKDEIRITPKQFDRAAGVLSDKQLIVVGKFKFNGTPKIHIRLNFDVYTPALDAWKRGKAELINSLPTGENESSPNGEIDFDQTVNPILPKGENPFYPKVNNDIPQTVKSLTETTTKTTTEIEKEIIKEKFDDQSTENIFLEFPLNDGSKYQITEQMISEWQSVYAKSDVRQAVKEMRMWLLSNPSKQKTRRGTPKFITGWLLRENEKASAQGKTKSGGDFLC